MLAIDCTFDITDSGDHTPLRQLVRRRRKNMYKNSAVCFRGEWAARTAHAKNETFRYPTGNALGQHGPVSVPQIPTGQLA